MFRTRTARWRHATAMGSTALLVLGVFAVGADTSAAASTGSGAGTLTVDLGLGSAGMPYGGQVCVTFDYLTGGSGGRGAECVASAAELPVMFSGVQSGTLEVSIFASTDGAFLVKQFLGGSNLAHTGDVIDFDAAGATSVTLPVVEMGTMSGSGSFEVPGEVSGDDTVELLVYTERTPGDWEQLHCTECGGMWDPFATTRATADGEFSLPGLVPGGYKVGFRASYGNDAYLADEPGESTVFYGGADLASATVVTVTAGATAPGIDAVLPLMVDPDPEPTPTPTPVKFSDISGNSNSSVYTQFYPHITWLANAGITKGWSAGNGKYEFRPKDEISREAMAAFLYRYAGSPSVKLPSRSPFKDTTPQSTHFYKEIIWLSQQGISTGWSVGGGKKEFRPKDEISREATAAFLYRFAGKPRFSPPSRSPFKDTTTRNTNFYKEVTWLASTGISTGWSVGGGKKEFRPKDEISREATAAFLYRYDKKY